MVFDDSLVGLSALISRLDDITEEERLYLEYFKAYCHKKTGFLFEAREMLLKLADIPDLTD
jgi:hypothetical protein